MHVQTESMDQPVHAYSLCIQKIVYHAFENIDWSQ